jgi:hypothetical protein
MNLPRTALAAALHYAAALRKALADPGRGCRM